MIISILITFIALLIYLVAILNTTYYILHTIFTIPSPLALDNRQKLLILIPRIFLLILPSN